MRRDDINGRRAPRWAEQLLTRRYGRTLFGEARYRLVWAPARLERSGGVWTDWDQGSVVRRVAAMRWVQKYPALTGAEACWLIERWLPASSYGTPEQWYAPVSAGGTRLTTAGGSICACGDYPQFGDYEDIGARLYWYPTERHLVAAVGAVERGLAAAPATALGRAWRRTYRAQQEQEQRDRDFDHAAAELFDDASPAFGGAPMVGYGGTHRPALVEMAQRAGIEL